MSWYWDGCDEVCCSSRESIAWMYKMLSLSGIRKWKEGMGTLKSDKRKTEAVSESLHELLQYALRNLRTASWARAQISSRRLLIAMLEQQLELSRTAVKVADGKDEWSVAASPTVPSPVGVPRRCLAVFGPPAEDLIGAVVAAAAGHAWRGLVDLKPRLCRQGEM